MSVSSPLSCIRAYLHCECLRPLPLLTMGRIVLGAAQVPGGGIAFTPLPAPRFVNAPRFGIKYQVALHN